MNFFKDRVSSVREGGVEKLQVNKNLIKLKKSIINE
jgi:hypothetical protein